MLGILYIYIYIFIIIFLEFQLMASLFIIRLKHQSVFGVGEN